MQRSLLGLTAIAVLVGFLFWWFSPVQVVKRRSNLLWSTLTLEEGGGKGSRHAGVYTLNALLAPEVALESPEVAQANGTFERSELENAFSWLCDRVRVARFEGRGFDKVVVEDGRAIVTMDVDAMVDLGDRRPLDGRHRVILEWTRDDRHSWRLARASWSPEGTGAAP